MTDLLDKANLLDFLLSDGRLTDRQAERFIEFAAGDALAYQVARDCLYWYQRPFAKLILVYGGMLVMKPKVVKFRALDYSAQIAKK